jgi:hypothetical protein
MASSFVNQIPTIVHLIQKINPKTVLDIGKGFGKYGFLIHEYVGIDNTVKLNPMLPMKDQSRVAVDAVEVDNDLMLPHLHFFYNKVIEGDVLQLYKSFNRYDLILMIDIIEHIEKEKALAMLQFFVSQGSSIIVATPKDFFQQELYESEYEHHVSHWTKDDFKKLGYLDYQRLEAGMVYYISPNPISVRGFGSGLIKKIRRIGRAIITEL